MSGELAARAFCWRLERKDGFGLAMTSHDRALEVDGVRYEAAPGMTPAAIKRSVGLEPSSCEATGVLTSTAIGEADLMAGRWDGATMRLSSVDWEVENAALVPLLTGKLGTVQAKGSEFTADLLGAAAALDAPVCPQTSPECRAELGDPHCRVDMAGRSVRAIVVSHDGATMTLDRSLDDRFQFGTLRALSGPTRGISVMIVGVSDAELSLRSSGWPLVPAGTVVLLREGCDKRLETCSVRFANAANFRGEPHLPGNDLLTRYPGG